MPSNPQSVTELEGPGHLAHQRHEWIIERIGWGLMAAVVLAALVGLLGPGPLSRRTAVSRDGGLFVDYYGVERSHAPGELRFALRPPAPGADAISLRVSRSFLDAAKIQEIVPVPDRIEATNVACVYSFRVKKTTDGEAHDSGSDGTFPVTIRYEHDEFGRFEHEFAAGDDQLRIVQWVLP